MKKRRRIEIVHRKMISLSQLQREVVAKSRCLEFSLESKGKLTHSFLFTKGEFSQFLYRGTPRMSMVP